MDWRKPGLVVADRQGNLVCPLPPFPASLPSPGRQEAPLLRLQPSSQVPDGEPKVPKSSN